MTEEFGKKEEFAKYVQRLPKSLHEKAKQLAKKRRMSLNSYVMSLVEQDIDRDYYLSLIPQSNNPIPQTNDSIPKKNEVNNDEGYPF